MANDVSPYARSYNSFSGTDIKAVFGSQIVGELQAISYSITREKGPIYTMGSPSPRAYARGKRGIAGTLVFIMFDSSGLMNAAKKMKMSFFADEDEIYPGVVDPTQVGPSGGATGFDELQLKLAGQGDPVNTSNLPALGSLDDSEIESDTEFAAGEGFSGDYRTAWYADQVPPFDITLAAANEYGAIAVMKIWGVEILNEGYGVSIDDIVSEEQMTFVARDITKWIVVANPNTSKLTGATNPY